MNSSAINTLFGIQATPAAAAKPASNSPAFGEMLSREMNVRQNASRPEPAPTGIRPAPPNSSNTPRPPERNQTAQGANQQAAAPQQEQPADRPASGDADQVQSADAQGAAATAATNAGDKAAKPGKKDKSDKTDKTDDRATAADPTTVSSASAELLALVNSMLPRPAAVVDAATTAAAAATAGGPVDPKAVLVKGAAVRLAGDPTAGVADHADGKADPAFDALLAQAAHATSARNVARADLDTKGKQSAADGLPSARADTSLEPGAGVVTPGQAAAQNIRSDEPVIAAVQAAAGKAEPGIAIGTVALAGAIPASLTQAAGSAATDTLTPHVGTPAWDHALGQKVVWMAAGAEQSASLTLNPPDLGPIQIVINVSNSQADASFTAAQPEVRQALEAALPRLKEMLGEAGITLGQASVSAGNPNQNGPAQQHAGNGAGRGSGAAGTGPLDTDPVSRSVSQPISGGIGLVDTFA